MVIPLSKPHFGPEELEAVQNVLSSGWVSGSGPKNAEFGKNLARYVGVKYAVPVANCTAALQLSLMALDVREGDEVLVADYTYPATAHAVLHVRAKPVFVDVDLETYNISPGEIPEKISDKTKAIIPVHTFGQPADMNPICRIARKHGLKVIEDAACALGSKYGNRNVGSLGDTACFSFHARKNITTGEGGAVTTRNKKVADKIRMLSCFGAKTNKKYANTPRFVELGFNFKLSDISAAIGIEQLKKVEWIIRKRRVLADYYRERLSEFNGVTPPFVGEGVTHVYQSFVCVLNKKINRDKVIHLLKKDGIETQIGTYSCHIQPVYNSNDVCPNSMELFRRSIALPLYYDMAFEDVDFVVNRLKRVLDA
jgi:dTDP-4-amino-4,6-dideoxygalactose transaminase